MKVDRARSFSTNSPSAPVTIILEGICNCWLMLENFEGATDAVVGTKKRDDVNLVVFDLDVAVVDAGVVDVVVFDAGVVDFDVDVVVVVVDAGVVDVVVVDAGVVDVEVVVDVVDVDVVVVDAGVVVIFVDFVAILFCSSENTAVGF